jgi:hypothetical protein
VSQWSGEGFGPGAPGAGPSDPPPGWDSWAGWSEAGVGAPPNDPRIPDLSALIALVDGLRRAIPPELRDQFVALQRELLLTVRSLIDWYLERLDAPPREAQVEDIPID